MVGKDQPPDLASLVPSETPSLVGAPEKVIQNQAPDGNHAPAEKKNIKSVGKLILPDNKNIFSLFIARFYSKLIPQSYMHHALINLILV